MAGKGGRIVPTMIYIRMEWKHTDPRYPVVLYAELETERGGKARVVNVYADGRHRFGTYRNGDPRKGMGMGDVPLGVGTANDPQCEPREISAAEFEEVWAKRPNFRRRYSKFIISGLVIVALLGYTIFHLCSTPSQPESPFANFHYYRDSTSPDKRYKCVVAEKNPPVLTASPYLYRFAIIDVKGELLGSLPGDVLEINHDSCVLGIQDIVWDDQGVTIFTNTTPPTKIARCVIRDGKQHWTNLSIVPSSRPSASAPRAASQAADTRPASLLSLPAPAD